MEQDGKQQTELEADTERRERERARQARDHLANERTLLSWIRLSIAVSGLGFVVARFGLFLDEIFLQQPTLRRTPGLSVPIGVVLMLAGPPLALLAGWRFFRIRRELEEGRLAQHDALIYVLLIYVLLIGAALAELVLAGYLLYAQHTLGF